MRSEHNRRGWLRIGILVLLLAVILVTLAWQRMERLAKTDAVVTATVRQLWLSPEAYEGKRVATSGIVRVFLAGTPSEHFVVEQAGQHRIGLQEVERARLVSLLGALRKVWASTSRSSNSRSPEPESVPALTGLSRTSLDRPSGC